MLKQELHKPLVSIVIPCYNCERFVGEAIESAMAQSYSPVEIIVVDDGSIDNSREVIARYPVRLFCIDHQGVSAARNRGIDESAGEFLLFLDSDDRLLPNAVACGVKILTDHPDVAIALNNLAELYRQQGRYTDAEQLLQRTLAIGEKSLGPASRVTSWLRP